MVCATDPINQPRRSTSQPHHLACAVRPLVIRETAKPESETSSVLAGGLEQGSLLAFGQGPWGACRVGVVRHQGGMKACGAGDGKVVRGASEQIQAARGSSRDVLKTIAPSSEASALPFVGVLAHERWIVSEWGCDEHLALPAV